MQNEIFNSNNVKRVLVFIESERQKAKNALEAGSTILNETLNLSVDSPFMAASGENARKIQNNWNCLSTKFNEFDQILLSLLEKVEEATENNQNLENTTNIEILDV